MKKVFNILPSLLAFFLLIPAFLILITWHALPGDRIYPIKIKLERIAVRLMGETVLARQLEVRYTKRRFSEADKLLAEEHSTVGFALVTAQAKTAKEKVVQAQDTQTKEDLIISLIGLNQELEKRKEKIIGDIEETQEEIDEIIDELEKEMPTDSGPGSKD